MYVLRVVHVASVHTWTCLSVCLSVCVSVCLSVCVSVCLSVCLSISISLENQKLSKDGESCEVPKEAAVCMLTPAGECTFVCGCGCVRVGG